jgi:hypothetical protein
MDKWRGFDSAFGTAAYLSQGQEQLQHFSLEFAACCIRRRKIQKDAKLEPDY